MMQRATLKQNQQLAEWVCCWRVLSSILEAMKRYRTLRIGQLLLKVGGVAIGLVVALLATFRDLFATADTPDREDNSQEGDLTGDYNFRTRKFDNGTDPYGWYEEDL